MTNDELSPTFRKKCFLFFAKSAEKLKKYFTYTSIKIDAISKTFITKMISTKSSTNPESFIKFGRGRRIGWRLHMDTPKCSIEKYKEQNLVWAYWRHNIISRFFELFSLYWWWHVKRDKKTMMKIFKKDIKNVKRFS